MRWCMSGATPRKSLGYDQGPEPWTTTSCVLSRVGRKRAAYLPPTQTDCLLTPQGYHSLSGEGLKNHLPRQTACDHSLPRVGQKPPTHLDKLPLSQLTQRGLRRVLAEGRQDSKSWNTLQASTSGYGLGLSAGESWEYVPLC